MSRHVVEVGSEDAVGLHLPGQLIMCGIVHVETPLPLCFLSPPGRNDMYQPPLNRRRAVVRLRRKAGTHTLCTGFLLHKTAQSIMKIVKERRWDSQILSNQVHLRRF